MRLPADLNMARKVALGLLLVVALAASLPAIEATCCNPYPNIRTDWSKCCGNVSFRTTVAPSAPPSPFNFTMIHLFEDV